MVTKDDYQAELVEAARSVMIELIHLLGEFRQDIVLVGGWVPSLLFPDSTPPHLGSTDIDLALNHKKIKQDSYHTICKILLERDYKETSQPYVFKREVIRHGKTYEVQVDLLAGEYEGAGKSHRHQRVQDAMARKARGCDLAFEQYVQVKLEGVLPNGSKDSVVFNVASIIPFIVMKGMAIANRLKEKDAWDINFCLQNYPGGVKAAAKAFKPFLAHGLVQEGLKKIADKFDSVDHVGPVFVTDFEKINDPEERQIRQREVFERMQLFFSMLGLF